MAVLALHTDGIYIKNSSEDVVHFIAIQVTRVDRMKIQGSGSEASSPSAPTWFTEADVTSLKSKGFNCIELSANWLKHLMPTRGTPDTSWFTTWVDVWVDWCVDHDVYCIIDMLALAYTYAYTIPDWFWEDAGYDEPVTKADWDAVIRDFFDTDVSAMDIIRAAFADLWEWIADRYSSYNNVLISPINEPLWQVDKVNWDTSIHLGETYSELMEQIITEIRKASNALVMVNCPFLSDMINHTQPVSGTNVVWELHAYISSYYPTLGDWQNVIDTRYARFVTTFGKPMFVGEYGFIPRDYGKDHYPENGYDWFDLLQDMVNYMDAKEGICGKQWHSFDDMEEEYFDWANDYFTEAETNAVYAIIQAYGGGDGEYTPLFESGFETETDDFNVEWQTKYEGSGETATVVTTDPYQGLKHARFTCDGSSSGEQCYTYKYITPIAELWVRGLFQIKTNLPASTKSYDLLQLKDTDKIAIVSFFNDAGTKKLKLSYLNGAGMSGYYLAFDYELDKYYSIKIYAKIHATEGAYKVWIDGDLKIDLSGLDTSQRGNIDTVMVGELYSNGATAHEIYVDSVVVDDEDIAEPKVGQNLLAQIL